MVWEQVKAIDHHLSVPLHNCASIGLCEYVVFLLAVAFNPCILPFLWAAALLPYPISPQLILACYGSILLTLVLTLLLKTLILFNLQPVGFFLIFKLITFLFKPFHKHLVLLFFLGELFLENLLFICHVSQL